MLSEMSEMVTIRSLSVSPVKSLPKIRYETPGQSMRVTGRGLEHSHMWCLVAPGKRVPLEVMTFRKYKKMAHLVQELLEDTLRIKFPDGDGLSVPFDMEPEGGLITATRIQNGEEIVGREVSEEMSAQFADYFGVQTKFLAFPEDGRRLVNPAYRRPEASNELAYQDGSAISLGSLATYQLLWDKLEELAELAGEEVVEAGEDRLRADVVTEGSPPRDEIYWRRVRGGGFVAEVAGVSLRCNMPARNTSTGEYDPPKTGVAAAMRESFSGVREDGEEGELIDLNLNPVLPESPEEEVFLTVGQELEVTERSQTPNVRYGSVQ